MAQDGFFCFYFYLLLNIIKNCTGVWFSYSTHCLLKCLMLQPEQLFLFLHGITQAFVLHWHSLTCWQVSKIQYFTWIRYILIKRNIWKLFCQHCFLSHHWSFHHWYSFIQYFILIHPIFFKTGLDIKPVSFDLFPSLLFLKLFFKSHKSLDVRRQYSQIVRWSPTFEKLSLLANVSHWQSIPKPALTLIFESSVAHHYIIRPISLCTDKKKTWSSH